MVGVVKAMAAHQEIERESASEAFDFRGGHVALDFANTVGWRLRETPIDFLTDYAELVAWSEQAGLLGSLQARRLRSEARRRPKEAAVVLQRAKALRETIYRLGAAQVRGEPPRDADVAAINEAVIEAMGHRRVKARGADLQWEWTAAPADLDRMLWPLVWAAANLMTGDRREARGPLRQCAGDPCGWLFLDTSNTRRRRWCSMADCGNVAKVRRHRARRTGMLPAHGV